MITALDHITVAVADLDAAVAAYEMFLGRRVNWRGASGGAEQAWIQLPNMALNLVSPSGDGAWGDQARQRLADRGEGLWRIAFTAQDLEAVRSQAGRRGVATGDPVLRVSRSPDGAERRWRLSEADPATTAGVDLALVDVAEEPWPVSPPVTTDAAAISLLDHVVINTPNPDRALALYGARLGLDFRLERSNPAWGSKLMFFRCGGAVVEIGAALKDGPPPEGPDRLSGLAWRVSDPDAARARLAACGLDVSEVRQGRKPGTRVFTVRSGVPGAPTLLLAAEGVEVD